MAGISARFSRFAFVLIIYQSGRFDPFVLLYIKSVDDWSLVGEQ